MAAADRRRFYLGFVETPAIEEALQRPDQDSSGICHDISTMAKLAIRSTREADQIPFSVLITGKMHAMKLHIGPGDTAAPVLTLMLPYED